MKDFKIMIQQRIFNPNIKSTLQIGAMYLTAEATTVCVNKDTDYKITGTFVDGNNKGFDIDTLGKIIFTGETGTIGILTGISDLSADKVCEINYTLYKNGLVVPNATTPCSINNPNKAKAIAITRPCNLTKDDYLEIFVQSDTDNTTVKHFSLMITIICDR